MAPLLKKSAAQPNRVFVTLEGIDGCGKSTQARLLAAALERAGREVLLLREPGGSAISEQIRALVLDPANDRMADACELLLYEAARAQVVHEVIEPALAAGTVVVCDRFYDSTTAYQGFANGMDLADVACANELAVGGCRPSLTLVYDLDPALAAQRRRGRDEDRIEAKGRSYQERVATGFRAIAEREPERVRLIDATGDVAHVFYRTLTAVRQLGIELSDQAAREAFLAESAGA